MLGGKRRLVEGGGEPAEVGGTRGRQGGREKEKDRSMKPYILICSILCEVANCL